MPAARRAPLASIAASAAALTLALAVAAPAADAPLPEPVVRLDASVSPDRRPIPEGTPLSLTLDTRFGSEPAGGNFVLQSAAYRFGRGARFNWDLFPSCAAATLRAANGRLSACPAASRIGGGYAAGTAVAVGVRSRATIALFNGPGGRSVTMNVLLLNPAYINETLSIPLTRLRGGRYTLGLQSTLPEEFKTILDGDVVVSRLFITTGATRVVDGRRRGLFEAHRCPRGGSAVHAEFEFNQGRSASANLTVPC